MERRAASSRLCTATPAALLTPVQGVTCTTSAEASCLARVSLAVASLSRVLFIKIVGVLPKGMGRELEKGLEGSGYLKTGLAVAALRGREAQAKPRRACMLHAIQKPSQVHCHLLAVMCTEQ